jgi:phosphoribosylformylglycinamidine (FGAM) synthase-like amidotransferase family enzyme
MLCWFPAGSPTGIISGREQLLASRRLCRQFENSPTPVGWFWAFATDFRFSQKPVETADSPFTNQLGKGDVLEIPIGHMEGNYFCAPDEFERLKAEDRIAFRYAAPGGQITAEANPNGSLDNIAGILNEKRNVLGMMPHPDRSSEAILGSRDGWKIFSSMIEVLATR